jgi:hypothetical protein
MSKKSYTTAMASHMSNLPTIEHGTLLQYANIIFVQRRKIIDFVHSSKYTLREVLSSTQIYQILKRCGIHVELLNLKVLLRELGFKFNGPSTSLTHFFSACKAFIHGISGGYTDS